MSVLRSLHDTFFAAFVWLLCSLLFASCSSFALATEPVLHLGEGTIKLDDSGLWQRVKAPGGVLQRETLPATLNSTPVHGSIIGTTGAYLTKLKLSKGLASSHFVVVGANFLDTGLAYWKAADAPAELIADFSSVVSQRLPDMLHAQAFSLNLPAHSEGELWILISAQYYPTPITLTLYNASDYYHAQGVVGLVTQGAIFAMLTLALLALAVYTRTRLTLTFWFAGYVGLHGIGWAVASGQVNNVMPAVQANLTYGGMYIFPIAIACAAMFTAGLFNTREQWPKHHLFFKGVAIGGGVAAVIMVWLPFTIVFYLSHLFAMVWVLLSIYTGVTMFSREGFKAKYYLAGNVFYGSSLIYYSVSHAFGGVSLPYPELVVLSALALDCFCILLSLSEWLRVKQQEITEILYQAKIDMLTNVGNRFAMDKKLSELSGEYWIVFIDFDGMKSINDSLGHKEGDRFLIEAASLMRDQIAMDDSVFRVGGDEFVWLVEAQGKDLTTLKSQLTECLNQIEADLKGKWPSTGISYGFSQGTPVTDKVVSLSEADKKMYRHKQSKLSHASLNRD